MEVFKIYIILEEGNYLLRRIGEKLLQCRQTKWMKELMNDLSEKGVLSECEE